MNNKTEIITCSEFNVLKNVKHAFLGIGSNYNKDNLQTLQQIHSNKVITASEKLKERAKADAMVTTDKKVTLGILTADCSPVLFADNEAKVIGAAHAGWKGACNGILENTVSEMRKLGANKIHAVIGPTIIQSSYEIGPEFYEHFIKLDKNNAEFFIPSTNNGHYMFDLPAYIESRLKLLNLALITNVRRDTCSDNNFFSYRRSCLAGVKDYGRNLAVISLSSQELLI